MIRRFCMIAALALSAVSTVTCKDIYAPKAQVVPVADTLQARALNGTPVGSPSTLDVLNQTVAPPTIQLAFDIAFDINDAGKTVLIPVAQVGRCTRICQVGLQPSGVSFEASLEAPARGYSYDTPTTVDVGQTMYIVAKSSSCAFSQSSDLYAKIVVDSVQTVDRRIFFRIVTDPNCGFRSFVLDRVPKS